MADDGDVRKNVLQRLEYLLICVYFIFIFFNSTLRKFLMKLYCCKAQVVVVMGRRAVNTSACGELRSQNL